MECIIDNFDTESDSRLTTIITTDFLRNVLILHALMDSDEMIGREVK